jgi:hypothetical protein
VNALSILARDARFWVALVLFGRAVLFTLAPDFPEPLWLAFDTFVAAVLAILAGNNVVVTRRAERAVRK